MSCSESRMDATRLRVRDRAYQVRASAVRGRATTLRRTSCPVASTAVHCQQRQRRSPAMEFAFTDEQDQFRDVVRRFLTDKSPTTQVRRLMESPDGFDPAVWRQLSADLALTGLDIPEAYGGAGFGPIELGIAMEEQG